MIATTRLPYESAKAYNAFRIYAEMGDKRSLRAVGQKLGKSTTIIERWSSEWKWGERIAALQVAEHDRQVAVDAQAKLETARAKEQLTIRVQKRAADQFEKLHDKADELLAMPIRETKIEKFTAPDGKVYKQMIVKPAQPGHLNAATRMIEAADTLGRLAAGLPTSNTGKDGFVGETLPMELNVYLTRNADGDEITKLYGERPSHLKNLGLGE
jgi:hypothetical protein